MAREKLCVGIDIGASAIKLCQLRKTGRGYALEHFGMAPLPPQAVVDGELMHSVRIVETVRSLIDSHRIKSKHVALSVSGNSVIIKKIPLPHMSREELEQSIQWEAAQFIPFDVDDVNIDVQIVPSESHQQGQMDVVLVAAKKDLINEYTAVLTEAGLEPVICDVDSFAIENMFDLNYEGEVDSTLALVNVGASKTNINIITDGVSSFTRDLTIGGNAVTEEIQKEMHLSFEEAEALKVDAEGFGDPAKTEPEFPVAVNSAIVNVAESITNQIQRTVDFFSATSADSSPARIYLSGGTAQLDALTHALESRMGIPVQVVDPFRKVQIPAGDRDYLASVGPTAGVAVGLALRYRGDAP